MQVRVYRSFEELPQSFIEGNRFPAQRDYFQSNQWYSNLFENVLCNELDLRVYIVFADGSTEAIEGALFCGKVRGEKKLVSLTNYYSLEYGPVYCGKDPDKSAIVEKLIDYISREKPAWNVVELRFLHSGSQQYKKFIQSFRNAGFYPHEFFQYENWFYPINEKSFSDYYVERPSKLKNTIKRKGNKLRSGYDLQIKFYISDDAELEAGIRAFIAVYDSSWKNSEPHPQFVPQLMRSCAGLGNLFLGVMYLDSNPVAAQLWLSTASKFIIYKLAYDEGYKNLSVGSILSKNMFEEIFNRCEYSEIDYGIGSEAYKRDWMSDVRLVGGISAYNKKTCNGFMNACYQQLKTGVKKIGLGRRSANRQSS